VRVRADVASVFGLYTAGGHRWLARHRGFVASCCDGSCVRRREGIGTSVSVSGGTIQNHVGAGSDAATADVLLVGYLHEATTPIGRGENSGRTLKESNIVLWLHELGRWNGKPREFEMSVSRLPENVTGIAVLIQPAGQGAILGAVAQPIR
jgi:hypothetical protein